MELETIATKSGRTFSVADHLEEEYLLDLDVADRIRDELLRALLDVPRGSVVVVNLDHVVTRASCVARFLGVPLRKIATGELEGRYLVLQGPLDYLTERDVQLALDDEGVVAGVREGKTPRLIGRVGRVIEETYQVLLGTHGDISSAMLTEPPLNLDIKTANARISKLSEVGLLHRIGESALDAGGRRYVYRIVQ